MHTHTSLIIHTHTHLAYMAPRVNKGALMREGGRGWGRKFASYATPMNE